MIRSPDLAMFFVLFFVVVLFCWVLLLLLLLFSLLLLLFLFLKMWLNAWVLQSLQFTFINLHFVDTVLIPAFLRDGEGGTIPAQET